MKFIADLHIHSKYSRATAKNLDLENLYLWAQYKGIHVVGTGDFNSDSKTDLVLQNNSGAIAVWDMNGSTISQSGVLANPGPTWSVVGDGRHIG